MCPVGQAPLLELEAIEKSFGAQKILKGISLQVFPGEFLTFLGPSGCGKTTTLRIIGGFDVPDSGTVRLKGQDVTQLPPYARDVHTVFQHYALFPHYNVSDNVAFGLRIKDIPEPEIERRVAEALGLVKLSGFEKRRIEQLSGGQQQRVALARAIVCRPSLLLLDEPLGALDLKLRRQMQLELKGIQRALGIAFIYVTHDQEEALTLSDRIAVFNAGEIVQLGEPKSIYEYPMSSFVADFIGSANLMSAEVSSSREGGIRLKLEGELEISLPPSRSISVREGEKIPVAIRPERIAIHLSKPEAISPGHLCFSATLYDAVYLGASMQVLFSPFSDRRKILTAVTMAPETLRMDRGSSENRKIWIEIRSADILLLDGVSPSLRPPREMSGVSAVVS